MERDSLAVAERAARAGGEEALAGFRGDRRVTTKAHKNDLVSDADEAAQERVVAALREASDAPIVGEEDGQRSMVPDDGRAWIVDPIDGTANYLRGVRLWTTSVAFLDGGEPAAAATVMPALDDAYVADGAETRLNDEAVTVSERDDLETFAVAVLGWGPLGEREGYARLAEAIVRHCGDMRRFGSMQSALAFVATGRLDAAIATRRPNPWDSVAGVRLIRQAGGRVTGLDGERWRHDSDGLVASNGADHEAVLSVARAAAD
ncbi:MAG: inositol monophosphatase [Haloarculaceae archaeon]